LSKNIGVSPREEQRFFLNPELNTPPADTFRSPHTPRVCLHDSGLPHRGSVSPPLPHASVRRGAPCRTIRQRAITCSWLPLVAPGRSWVLLVFLHPLGPSWTLLGAPGASGFPWSFLAALGSFLALLPGAPNRTHV